MKQVSPAFAELLMLAMGVLLLVAVVLTVLQRIAD
jgi:hypothetical protein